MTMYDLLGDTSGVDEDINLAVVIDDILDGLTHSLAIADIDAVEADVDASLVAKITGSLVSELLLHIHNGNASDTDLSERLRHVVAKATATAVKDCQ